MGWRLAKCPSCGGSLNVETDRNVIFCQYCGAKLQKTDDRIVIEHVERKIDETENKRIELEDKKFSTGEKTAHWYRVIALVALILGVICFAIFETDSMISMVFFLIAGYLWMVTLKKD